MFLTKHMLLFHRHIIIVFFSSSCLKMISIFFLILKISETSDWQKCSTPCGSGTQSKKKLKKFIFILFLVNDFGQKRFCNFEKCGIYDWQFFHDPGMEYLSENWYAQGPDTQVEQIEDSYFQKGKSLKITIIAESNGQ